MSPESCPGGDCHEATHRVCLLVTTSEALDDERRNVVIYLESTPSITAKQRGNDDLVMAQLGETFLPHVLAVVKGTTVEFPNQDPIFHNRVADLCLALERASRDADWTAIDKLLPQLRSAVERVNDYVSGL